jgi:hypothetical protein
MRAGEPELKLKIVGTVYRGTLRSTIVGDPEALGRPCTCGIH